jgi:hypothetical protein
MESAMFFTAMLVFPGYLQQLAWLMAALVFLGTVQRTKWLVEALQ